MLRCQWQYTKRWNKKRYNPILIKTREIFLRQFGYVQQKPINTLDKRGERLVVDGAVGTSGDQRQTEEDLDGGNQKGLESDLLTRGDGL